jgi:hypothetical protein
MFDTTNVCAEVTVLDREQAVVEVRPKRKKVAIVGFATNTLHLVPWNDPTFEIWGLNQGYLHMHRRADRWFEMHMPEATADVRDPAYLTWLSAVRDFPIYMIQTNPEIPNAVRYPIEAAIASAGPRHRDYFTSSPAFMLAVAGLEGFEEVHLYGINLAIGDEYFFEKACAEYWIGLLEGRGVNVYVPSASSLLKQYRRYGYAIDARPSASYKALMTARRDEYRAKAEQHSNELHVMLGAMREDEALMQIAEGIDHGADLVLVPPLPAPSTAPPPAAT